MYHSIVELGENGKFQRVEFGQEKDGDKNRDEYFLGSETVTFLRKQFGEQDRVEDHENDRNRYGPAFRGGDDQRQRSTATDAKINSPKILRNFLKFAYKPELSPSGIFSDKSEPSPNFSAKKISKRFPNSSVQKKCSEC